MNPLHSTGLEKQSQKTTEQDISFQGNYGKVKGLTKLNHGVFHFTTQSPSVRKLSHDYILEQ